MYTNEHPFSCTKCYNILALFQYFNLSDCSAGIDISLHLLLPLCVESSYRSSLVRLCRPGSCTKRSMQLYHYMSIFSSYDYKALCMQTLCIAVCSSLHVCHHLLPVTIDGNYNLAYSEKISVVICHISVGLNDTSIISYCIDGKIPMLIFCLPISQHYHKSSPSLCSQNLRL